MKKIDRFILCQYCDDVRNEIDGKISLIGIYGGGMHVNAVPTVVQKLWVVCHVGTSPDEPFINASLKVRHDEKEVLSVEMPTRELVASVEGLGDNPMRRGFMMTLAFVLPPIEIQRSGHLSVSVDVNGTSIEANRLLIKAAGEAKN